MKTTLFIIRGLPGSGKSTLADRIVSDLMAVEGVTARYKGTSFDVNAIKVEMDQFFLSSNGHKEVYAFDRRFLGAAHDECYGRTMRYLRSGYNVAVANTFSTRREVERYVQGLSRCGLDKRVELKVIKCVGKFKSPHNVPSRAVYKMKDNWQDVPGEVTFNGEF